MITSSCKYWKEENQMEDRKKEWKEGRTKKWD